MIVVEALLVVAVLFAVAAVAAGRGGSLAEAPRDAADVGFPTGRAVRAEDLESVRFSMALRGYRMAEVDEALDRLADELADRDARIAELEAGASPTTTTTPSVELADDAADPEPRWRRPGGSRQVPSEE